MANFSTAWKAFWTIFASKEKADAWNALQQDTPQRQLTQQPEQTDNASNTDEAVHALAILQRESRLIDFIMEDISECDDEQVGSAVRKIHADAQAALKKYFDVVPIQDAPEGEAITLQDNFDNRQIRLTGKPAANPPFSGTLVHKGWKAQNVTLPTSSASVDKSVITPAEIDIQ